MLFFICIKILNYIFLFYFNFSAFLKILSVINIQYKILKKGLGNGRVKAGKGQV
jgi:hypothetical protein